MTPGGEWELWFALVATTFAVLEGLALGPWGEKWTLSFNLRKWLGIYPHRWWVALGFALLNGSWLWLMFHLYVQR